MARILLDAICSGNTSLAKDLIQDESFRGVDSQTSRRDGTALFFCSSRGYVDLALLLLAKSANVDARNKCQATPLHAAADNDHLRIVKLLLDRGANINAQTHRGDTALHLAAFRGHADVAQCLVEHGADFQLANDSNVSAATGATVQGHVEVGQYLNAINDLYGQPKHPLNIMDSTSEGMIVLETPSLTSSINEPSYPLRHRQNSAYPGSPFAQGAYSSSPFPINNPNTSDDMVGYFETNNNNNPTTTNNNNDAFNNMGEIGTVRVQQQPRPITPQAINKSSSPSQHYVPCPNSPTSPMSVDIFPPPRRNSEINTRSTSDTTSTLISNPTSEPTLPTPMHTTTSSSPPPSSSTTTTTSPNNSEFHPRNSNPKNCHRLSMTTTNAPAATTTPFSTDPSAHNNINNNTNNHPYQRQQQQQQASSTNHDESQSPLYYNLDAACYPRPHHQQNQQQHHHHHQHDIDHHRNCNSYNPQTHQLHRQRPQSTTPTPTNVFHLDSSNSSLFSGPSSTLIGHRSRSPPTLPKHPEENTDDSMIIYNPPSINPPNNDHPHQMSVATHRLAPTTTATTVTDGHHQPQLKDIISNNPSTTLQKESLFFSLQNCDENNDMANKPSNNRLRSDVHNSVHSYVSDGASTSSITSSFSGDARRINDDFDLLPSIPLINIPQHSQQQQQKLSDNSNRFTQQPHHNRSQTSSSPTPSPFFQKNTSTTTTNPPQPHQSVYHRLPSTPSSISSIDFGDPNAQPLNFDSPSSTQVTITTNNNKNAPCHYQQQYQQQQQQLQQQQYNNKIQRSYSPMNVEQLPVVESGACANDSLTGNAFRPMETSAGRRRMSVTGTDNKNGDSINDLVFNSPMSSNEYDDGRETFYQKDSTTHPRRGLVGSRNHNDYTTKSHLNSSENGMFMKSNFNGASFNTDNNSRRVTNMPGGILNDLSAVKKTRAGTCVNYLNIPVGST